MPQRWYLYLFGIILLIAGFALLTPSQIAQAAGPDVGGVSVYVYHDVNRDGIWNWGDVAPPNVRGDHAWRWDYPCTFPSTVCEMAEIGLVGADVALVYHGGEIHVGDTFHDGPALFALPVGTQVVGLHFLGTDDGRQWEVTNVSQKTVNEPAASQFEFNFPLAPAGPNSMDVMLVGVAEVGQMSVDCEDVTSAATEVAAGDVGNEVGGVSVYVYHDVNEDGIWNWGDVAPPNIRGDHAWRWDYPCTYPSTVCEMAEIGLVGADVALVYYGGETHVGETFHDGPALFAVPVGGQVVGVDFLGTDDGREWNVTNVSQKTVNEPAASQFEFDFPLDPAGPNSMDVLLMGVAEHDEADSDCEASTGTTYTIEVGDTLSGIAQAFGTTVEALASANGIANPNVIYAGAVITIP